MGGLDIKALAAGKAALSKPRPPAAVKPKKTTKKPAAKKPAAKKRT